MLSSSTISRIIDKLKSERCRDSTRRTYHNVWHLFAKFYARLDRKSKLWNDRILLFVTYPVDACKLKSTTVRSYISAIKGVLAEDGVEIENDSFELKALTRACRLKNDRVITRFPIYRDLLMLIQVRNA